MLEIRNIKCSPAMPDLGFVESEWAQQRWPDLSRGLGSSYVAAEVLWAEVSSPHDFLWF